jgi:hypothetical protein
MSRSDLDVVTGTSMPQVQRPVPQSQQPNRPAESGTKAPAPRQQLEKPS